MVKDKVIQMDNGREYYILEDIEYNGKKYILSLECNLENDTVNEEDYFIMELSVDNEELSIKQVLDDKVAVKVAEMLLSKIRNN